MKLTRAAAELQLNGCQGCNRNCNDCGEINSVIDSLMRIYTHEISAYEDADEMELERLLAG